MATKLTLNSEQKEAFEAIQKFIKHPAADVFVLKGYAGTGKTFLMQHLAKWLNASEQLFAMLASTGRAATVLRGKTGFEAKTVHGELYLFNKVEGDSVDISDDAPIDQFGQMTLQFSLRQPDNTKKIYIIDEASMLASESFDTMSLATFGSGELLQDFFMAVGSNKVIFVGDPCQLPPVGQTYSPALDMDWLANNKRTAVSYTITKIERTNSDNDILTLATYIRNLSEQTSWEKYPKLPAKGLKNVKIYPSQKALFDSYLSHYKTVGSNGTLAVARTNKMVQLINKAMRRDLFGDMNKLIQVNDVLLVTQNNYKVPLTNGDFVTVKSLGEIRTQANLHFQSAQVQAALSEQEFEILISLDILYGQNANFSKEQMRGLMVDFSRRMRKNGVQPNTEEYKNAMMGDDFLNCLRATFGYAVTCHKSQGGEWNDVYLFLDKGMYSMHRNELCRWWYTAVTRAKEQLHLSDDWWISEYAYF